MRMTSWLMLPVFHKLKCLYKKELMYKTIVIHARSTYWTAKESPEEMLVDADDLAKEMDQQIAVMEKEGFGLFTVTPINSGNIASGSGYFHTESLLLTFKK